MDLSNAPFGQLVRCYYPDQAESIMQRHYERQREAAKYAASILEFQIKEDIAQALKRSITEIK